MYRLVWGGFTTISGLVSGSHTLNALLFKHKKEAINMLYVQIYMRKFDSNFC